MRPSHQARGRDQVDAWRQLLSLARGGRLRRETAWRWGGAAGLLVLSCAGAAPSPEPRGNSAAEPAPSAAQAGTPTASTPIASATPELAPAASAPQASAAAAAPPVRELGVVTRSLAQPVLSLALGKPRVAALVEVDGGVTPWLLEADRWRAIPISERLGVTASDLKTARIYFGRDDKPRIMGARQVDGETRQLYLRYRGGEWKVEKAEIARLAGAPAAALFGLLGHADPEVVCKAGDQCIIKRLTGWQTMDAGPGTPRVDLQGKLAFAVYRDSVAVLDGLKWRTISGGAALADARGAWGAVVGPGAEYWISDAGPGAGRLWHGSAGSWQSLPSPVSGPELLWGTDAQDVWLAGASGLAHFDGTGWSQVAGASAALSEVFGRDDEVWASGASGVWRLKRAASPAAR